MGITKAYSKIIELPATNADRQCDKCQKRASVYLYTDGHHNKLRCEQHRDDHQ